MNTVYLPFTLTLKARAVISAAGGDPNSSKTLGYIPGSTLRGAVARTLGDPGTDRDSPSFRTFHDLVLSENIRYLNAYPRISGRRTIPAPASLQRAKYPEDDGSADGNRALEVFDFLHSEKPEKRVAGLPYEFLALGEARPTLRAPSSGARIHHQRDRVMGRAWTERNGKVEIARGAVYAYEYLESGQVFEGLVVLRGTEDEIERRRAALKARLPETLLVGRSRRGSYGGDTRLKWSKAVSCEFEGAGTLGLALQTGDLDPGQVFRVLLTSPYIGRNEDTGQPDPTWFEAEILQRLAEASGSDPAARVVKRWWGFETAGGFNRKWRLELPQARALAAGSVMLLEATRGIPAATLAEIQHAGLGERQTEGFGRVVFLDPPVAALRLEIDDSTGEAQAVLPPDPPEEVLALERRLLTARAHRAADQTAALLVQGAKRIPPNSLLGRLRTPLRGEAETGLSHLKTWLGSGEEALKA
ncbi:MAG: hypothetical protein KDD11_17730, partial [Acidobacteria bacterium]|nr:hypothetical protein [Acidobacteriota bacterium]